MDGELVMSLNPVDYNIKVEGTTEAIKAVLESRSLAFDAGFMTRFLKKRELRLEISHWRLPAEFRARRDGGIPNQRNGRHYGSEFVLNAFELAESVLGRKPIWRIAGNFPEAADSPKVLSVFAEFDSSKSSYNQVWKVDKQKLRNLAGDVVISENTGDNAQVEMLKGPATASLRTWKSNLKRLWERIRFGEMHEEVKSIDGGVVSEYAVIGRGGKVVGYWAYGGFDPSYPYQG